MRRIITWAGGPGICVAAWSVHVERVANGGGKSSEQRRGRRGIVVWYKYVGREQR